MITASVLAKLGCLLIFWWMPSLPGAVFVTAVWMLSLTPKRGQRGKYAGLCALALILLLCKVLVICAALSALGQVVLKSAQSLLMALGFPLPFPRFDSMGLVLTLCPETLVSTMMFSAWKELQNKQPKISPLCSGLLADSAIIILLFSVPTYRCCLYSLAYLLLGFLYVLNIVYWRSEKKIFLVLISYATATQFLIAFIGRVATLLEGLTVEGTSLEAFLESKEVIFTCLLYLLSRVQLEYPAEKFLSVQEELQEPSPPAVTTHLGHFVLYLKSLELWLVLLRLLVLLWISSYNELLGLAMMTWLFVSIFRYGEREVI